MATPGGHEVFDANGLWAADSNSSQDMDRVLRRWMLSDGLIFHPRYAVISLY